MYRCFFGESQSKSYINRSIAIQKTSSLNWFHFKKETNQPQTTPINNEGMTYLCLPVGLQSIHSQVCALIVLFAVSVNAARFAAFGGCGGGLCGGFGGGFGGAIAAGPLAVHTRQSVSVVPVPSSPPPAPLNLDLPYQGAPVNIISRTFSSPISVQVRL